MPSDLPDEVRELRRKILAVTLEAERPLSFNALSYQLDGLITDFRDKVIEAERARKNETP